jgi:hypothetical protein
MGLSGTLRTVVTLAFLPVIVGCAGVEYRERSTLIHTRYATVENFGDGEITAEQIDGLLEEVAAILQVSLLPDVPKVRVMVMPAGRISELYRRVGEVASHGTDARALYLPGANLVAVPQYSRTLLGHELAHYLTDHYLRSTPRRSWERIAVKVEDALPRTPAPVAPRSPAADVIATQAQVAPFLASAN